MDKPVKFLPTDTLRRKARNQSTSELLEITREIRKMGHHPELSRIHMICQDELDRRATSDGQYI